MRSYEERREERRQYEADVHYEAWRSGCREIDPDRIYDAYYEGQSAKSLVDQALYEQYMRAQQRQMSEEEYYDQQEGQQ